MREESGSGQCGQSGATHEKVPIFPSLPIAVIDFEASSLSLSDWPEISSYPIEVGIAIADEHGAITTWSSLIRPDARWKSKGEWDRRAERVHGISRDELDAGLSPREAANALNERLGGLGTVWCDGGRYDQHWLTVLFATAGTTPAFPLADVARILDADHEMRERYRIAMRHGARRHRAADDAADICRALLTAWGSQTQ